MRRTANPTSKGAIKATTWVMVALQGSQKLRPLETRAGAATTTTTTFPCASATHMRGNTLAGVTGSVVAVLRELVIPRDTY